MYVGLHKSLLVILEREEKVRQDGTPEGKVRTGIGVFSPDFRNRHFTEGIVDLRYTV